VKKYIYIIRTLISIFVTILFSFAYANSTFNNYSPATLEEKRMGNKVLQSIWDDHIVIKDIESQIYLKNLLKKLTLASDQPDRHYDIFLIKDDSINAFASWNGYIGVHNALITFSESESELAAIIAHEISHISQDHLKRHRDKIEKQKILTLGGIIASVMVNDENLNELIATTTIANDLQNQINYTREHEWEADNFSVKILEKTDFNIDGLGSFFNRIKEEKSAVEYLKTHPLNINRVANSQSRAENNKRNHLSSFDYETLKIRLKNSKELNLNLNNLDLDLYSKSYFSFQDNKLHEARKYVDRLLESNKNFSTLLLAGRIYGAQRQVRESEEFFFLASEILDNEVVRYYQSEMYLTNKKPLKALKLLKNFVKLNEPLAYTEILLGQIYLNLSEQDRFQFHTGNSELIKGRHEVAIKHYSLAQTLTQNKDFYDLLDSKIKLVDEEKELLKIKD